jgi:hypothetical protein
LYDPPRNFSSRNFSVGPVDAVVGQDLAYSFTDQRADSGAVVQAIELRSGEERWRAAIDAHPSSRPVGDSPLSSLVVGPDAAGKESVAYTGLRVTRGSGTQRDRWDVVVGILSAASGTWLGSVRAELPPGFDPTDTSALLAGANSHYVVSSVSDVGNLPVSLVVDPRTRTTAWTEKGFLALGLAGDVIVGMQIDDEYGSSGPLRVLDAATRAPIWTGQEQVPRLDTRIVAPGIIQILNKTIPLESSSTYLIDTKNGNRLADLGDQYRCVFDQREILVCDGNNALIGLEVATMRELWRLPESHRVQPKLHTAYHGLVYTEGSNNVILDARTGRDAIPSAAIAGFGLVRRDRLYSYLATG